MNPVCTNSWLDKACLSAAMIEGGSLEGLAAAAIGLDFGSMIGLGEVDMIVMERRFAVVAVVEAIAVLGEDGGTVRAIPLEEGLIALLIVVVVGAEGFGVLLFPGSMNCLVILAVGSIDR